MTASGAPGGIGLLGGSGAELVGRVLLESDLVAVVLLDERWRVVEASAATEALLGRPREELIGSSLHELIIAPLLRAAHLHGDAPPPIAQSPLLGRRTEETALRGDGAHVPIELILMPAEDGDPPRYVAFLRDITERRVAEYRVAKSQALLAEAEHLAGTGSFERDLRSADVEWSGGMYRLFGLPPNTPLRGFDEAMERIHPDDRQRLHERLQEIYTARGAGFTEKLRILRADGGTRTIEMQGKVVFDDFGAPERLVGTARDITTEEEARHARDLLSYVVESSDDAILTKSAEGRITSWNRGAELLYGYSAEEAIGQPISILAPPGLADSQAEMTARVFEGQAIHRLETTRLRKDGSEVAVSISITPVRDETGLIVSAAVIARDMTERRRYEERLQYLAEHDHLTGLLNRRRFEEELERELRRSARSGVGGAVLSIDLDGFKAINDSAGHAAGDTVLREVARAIARRLRDSDIIARLGGDEFAVLLPRAGAVDADAVARHLLEALHDVNVSVEGVPFRPTASIGVVLFPPGEARSDELIVDADLAMYTAKQQGRDRIVAFTHAQALAARADAKLSWGQRIRDALENDGLELHWQAIAEIASGEPSHGELLLRMRSGGKLLPPVEFLGPAERLGLIHAIDRWVVRSAIRLLADGRGPARHPLSVNLSGESVAGDADLLGLIERELRAARVDPGKIIFEVTETAAIANILEARQFAFGVRRLGCRIALDDFGTGFGSFYHLKHLPVDFLKIDREFVQHLPRNAVDRRLVRAIVDIAQALGIRTVAESVGDDETIETLRTLGVDFVQGFHVGMPTPVEMPPR
jgi:diguanylate cyclase (GGDEF)-like protein/PAS domain S-box-containing protein